MAKCPACSGSGLSGRTVALNDGGIMRIEMEL